LSIRRAIRAPLKMKEDEMNETVIIPAIDAKLRHLYEEHKGFLNYQGYVDPYGDEIKRINENREKLFARQDAIYLTMKWIEYCRIGRSHRFYEGRNSYQLKHISEMLTGYVSNGQFIAAACLKGFRFKPCKGYLNVKFDMESKDLSRLEFYRNYERQAHEVEKFVGWLMWIARKDPDLVLAIKASGIALEPA
jgi:hypothetical protein